jgi:Xaa-Pro dipeptidase
MEVTVERRDFMKVTTAGAALVVGAPASLAGEAWRDQEVPAAIAALKKRKAPPAITADERAGRRAAAQELMGREDLAAMFVEPGPTLDYYADVSWHRSERVFGMLLPQRGDPVFVCPGFEEARAQSQIGGRFDVRVWQEDESPYRLMADLVRADGHGTGRVAVDESARYFVAVGLAGAAPAMEIVSAAPVTHGMRGRKSVHEIEIMRFANAVTLEAYRAAFATLREGMTQAELAANVSAGMQRLGYAGGALVLFGEASAYPHGVDNPKPLAEGDVVLVDGGLSVHGYRSDMTRTVVFGTPSPEAEKVFGVVHEAQQAALAAARPGRTAGSVDAAARAVITRAGYGPGYKYFSHRLGHGIGLEGHEWPYLVKDNALVLEPGMTFSDEPGIYQYGKFGLRLEDIMVITDSGAELMTPTAKSLREIS